ncbi:MAG: hypothetical protein HKO59_05590 [Phycisphaerales bacterium]|nr:hypothetical protein [Phycisphaerae bacterium]NNM25445.1 hypothetical protein [Phycisphaerales bacterium]
MSQPFDSCRLYLVLRQRAWGQPDRAPRERGIVDVDRDLDDRALGLSRTETEVALEELLDARLLHRAEPVGEGRFSVAPLDDFTATTLLMSLH